MCARTVFCGNSWLSSFLGWAQTPHWNWVYCGDALSMLWVNGFGSRWDKLMGFLVTQLFLPLSSCPSNTFYPPAPCSCHCSLRKETSLADGSRGWLLTIFWDLASPPWWQQNLCFWILRLLIALPGLAFTCCFSYSVTDRNQQGSQLLAIFTSLVWFGFFYRLDMSRQE